MGATYLIVFTVVRPPKACTQAKVGELYVPIFVYQHIVRLYISAGRENIVSYNTRQKNQLCKLRHGEDNFSS